MPISSTIRQARYSTKGETTWIQLQALIPAVNRQERSLFPNFLPKPIRIPTIFRRDTYRDEIYESPESHAKLALAPQSSPASASASASAWEAAPFLLAKSVASRTDPRGPGKLDFTCPRDEII
ncbi:unnamed protein product [Fusarium venenatum]|uniref:Uncharacterized protein n=1 Tax=Fusarium venenatum TaxID=56646 RepID=A0A2L2T3U2_9HYPO|nr:uncharacterized protein FVRRES_00940 [Fusarium venenatum]CEI64428.1 unnamed protein product [Fusarium venenatum]